MIQIAKQKPETMSRDVVGSFSNTSRVIFFHGVEAASDELGQD